MSSRRDQQQPPPAPLSGLSSGFDRSINVQQEDDEEEEQQDSNYGKRKQYTADRAFFDEAKGENDDDPMAQHRAERVTDRENDYQKRRFARQLSPERADPFADAAPQSGSRTFQEVYEDSRLNIERDNVLKNIARKEEQDKQMQQQQQQLEKDRLEHEKQQRKRRRWDVGDENDGSSVSETPRYSGADATPAYGGAAGATPALGQRNAWGETPLQIANRIAMTPGATPTGNFGATPSHLRVGATPLEIKQDRLKTEYEQRNRDLSDAELDALLPATGYEIIAPPTGYEAIRTPSRKLTETPAPSDMSGLYAMPTEVDKSAYGIDLRDDDENLPTIKPEDMQAFGALLNKIDESELSADELRERQIMQFLLAIKNGTPPQRKAAMKQVTERARELGAGPLFNQILPILMTPTLEPQERHLMVKLIDRILYKLDDLVRPYVHKILLVIEPLLIDEDYYARVEGREIISNLAKAAGLTTMIATMRPDIDSKDEYVRNTTARAFAVVASALGIPSLLPFLKAVCQSKKSWEARHTGMKIVQQISILMGCAILPHLKNMVDIIQHGLSDENIKVKTMCALTLAALAESATPYGIDSFDVVLRPLWKDLPLQRSKVLAAYLKAIGYIIPLMDKEYASYYTKNVMPVLLVQFSSADEEMKKIVLKVVKQCVSTAGVDPQYVRDEVLPPFFANFWVRRMALDRRNFKQVVETTVELAAKVGGAQIMSRIVDDLKDESEPYRKMVMETIEKIVSTLGAADVDQRLEEQLIDGLLYAFQEQQSSENDDKVMLNGFGAVVTSLGARVKVYLPQVCGVIKWRLNNKSAKVRQQAAELVSRVAASMHACGEDKLMSHLGVVLYEYLGEEYPDVLASILGALKSIVNVIGMTKMTPPIKDLLPRLTPILKNRHERVQENCVDLVGRIADRGAEFVSNREWMRICFELLEMLRAPKKGIRRAAVNTFGYIAKAIGPQDVLVTLLNNLRVQDRVSRVCTTVAIAIVAETCSPFTVLPALMNEYRVPELNVQNGVLKAMSFLFEYIGEMGKDYIYAVLPLLEDALTDRDLVHRQTACFTVRHVALGAVGLGLEDSMTHLLNFVWPNVFEPSPLHLVNSVHEAIEGLSYALGPCAVMQYLLQGMFHPARKVRNVYWRIYNNMYVSQQDALVAMYPQLQDEAERTYRRHELDLFI